MAKPFEGYAEYRAWTTQAALDRVKVIALLPRAERTP
jgi:hypothetical protein